MAKCLLNIVESLELPQTICIAACSFQEHFGFSGVNAALIVGLKQVRKLVECVCMMQFGIRPAGFRRD